MIDVQLVLVLVIVQVGENVFYYNVVLVEQWCCIDEVEKVQCSWFDNFDWVQQGIWVKSLWDMISEQLVVVFVFVEVGQNVGEYNVVLVEQGCCIDEVIKKIEVWVDNLVKFSEGNWIKGLYDFIDEQLFLVLVIVEVEQNVGCYNVVLIEMFWCLDELGKKQDVWFDNFDKIGEGNWVKGLWDFDELQLQVVFSVVVVEQNVVCYNIVLVEFVWCMDEVIKSQDVWNDNVNKFNFLCWMVGFKNMSDVELDVMLGMVVVVGNIVEYNVVLVEQGCWVDDVSKKYEVWVQNLEKIECGMWVDSLWDLSDEEFQSVLVLVIVVENFDGFNVVLVEMKWCIDDVVRV